MAVIAGNVVPFPKQVSFTAEPVKWLRLHTVAIFSGAWPNPSRFPDRIWSRHSALLDAAWKQSLASRAE
ncbi:MAG: hypothetical protein ACQETD_09510 [Pseudomonadota bacterium]